MIPSSSNTKNTLSILHQVPEGHVRVYWRGGALLKTIQEPGFHLKMPLITLYEPVLVTLQTDLIDEKMKEALQGDCTRSAPGIEILSVRVKKSTIPESIRRNYEQVEEKRTKVLVSIERHKVAEKEAKTQKMAVSEAEKTANVSKILMEQKLMEKESSRRQQEIENQMYIARQKSL
ncbi:hypothetical protein CXB51_032637 [Gossypium anomalum]|uniref:Band 7 domain-containing protein n=1 Tax=Gossypium anomalum TaxID=47600 RepID=A0A8J5Y9R4_9ROSI|nr:hypothetical protein CXB51_032637 [Gossypium anomalum]